jgi:CheY-like chemotaxis protein
MSIKPHPVLSTPVALGTSTPYNRPPPASKLQRPSTEANPYRYCNRPPPASKLQLTAYSPLAGADSRIFKRLGQVEPFQIAIGRNALALGFEAQAAFGFFVSGNADLADGDPSFSEPTAKQIEVTFLHAGLVALPPRVTARLPKFTAGRKKTPAERASAALRKAQRASRSFASRTTSPGSLQLPSVQRARPGEGEDPAMGNRCLLLADAHPNMLAAVRDLLAGKFAATVMVADGSSLLEAVGRMEPDLVVVDLSLPVSGGVNVVRTLFSRYPGLRVIVLSVHDEQTALSQVLDAGAAGFVLKRTAAVDLTAAVDAVLRGETFVSGVSGRQPSP